MRPQREVNSSPLCWDFPLRKTVDCLPRPDLPLRKTPSLGSKAQLWRRGGGGGRGDEGKGLGRGRGKQKGEGGMEEGDGRNMAGV